MVGIVKGYGVVCREAGKCQVEELSFLPPGRNEIRLKICACGLCHSDVSVMNRVIMEPLPNVLGHEGAGVVESVGENVVGWKEGDRAILTLVAPCNRCPACLEGRPQLCANKSSLQARGCVQDSSGKVLNIMQGVGCMAEYAVVNEGACLRAPDYMPLDKGALVSCGVTTGVGAVLNCAQVRPGDSCCVIGCGGVGLSAIQGARISGAAQIVAVDAIESKLEAAKKFGATHCINAKKVESVEKAVRAVSDGGKGTNYTFEAAGLEVTANQAVNLTCPGGTTVFVGIPPPKATVAVSVLKAVAQEKKNSRFPHGKQCA